MEVNNMAIGEVIAGAEMTKAKSEPNDEVLTVEEAAAFLRVSETVIKEEIQTGALPAFKVGSELRILRKDFEQFIRSKMVPRAKTKPGGPIAKIEFAKSKPFTYQWPNKRTEDFDTVYEGRVGMKKVVVGYTTGTMHGKRRKTVVFVDRRPLVRFKAADDFDRSGLMVSVIKTIDRKQLRPDDPIPFEYSGFRIEPYRTHIDEPGTSTNMVVVCKQDDLQTMAQHALIRADQIAGRKL
jgi:excisionase family DNA binding protein